MRRYGWIIKDRFEGGGFPRRVGGRVEDERDEKMLTKVLKLI